MTPTKPTETEHELAIRNARALVRPVGDHAVPHDPIRVMLAAALLESEAALQRAIADRDQANARARQYLLDESEALAESERKRERLEERVRRLRATMMTIDLTIADGENVSERHTREALERDDALAADQTTARESAEDTAEETMTDDTTAMGPEDFGGTDEGSHYMSQERVASARVTAGAKGYVPFTLKGKPAQTPEPVEPSDEWFARHWSGPLGPGMLGCLRTLYKDAYNAGWVSGNERGYRAGLAAERAERVEWLKSDAARVELNAVTENGELKVELERVRAELAELKQNHEELLAEGNSRFDDYENQTGDALDKAGFRNNLPNCRDGSLARIARAGEELNTLRAQARARRVPTLVEFTAVLEDYCDSDNSRSDEWFYAAVLRLFAEADAAKSQVTDNEPPVPLPEVLPAGTQTRYGSIADGAVVLKEGSYYWGWWNKDADRERCAHADGIDWSHYRAQQRAAATPAVEERPWSYEAPPDSEVGQLHDLLDTDGHAGGDSPLVYRGRSEWGVQGRPEDDRILGHSVAAWRPASAAPAKEEQCSVCSAWLKRTVEELTTAEGVEVWCGRVTGILYARAANHLRSSRFPFDDRDKAMVERILREDGWPLRNAKPAEPTPQLGGGLDALTARVAHLEDQVRGMAEGTASEFRRVDATLRAHSERIEAGVDALKCTERYLDRGVDAQSKRLDELERKVRELDQRTIGSAK